MPVEPELMRPLVKAQLGERRPPTEPPRGLYQPGVMRSEERQPRIQIIGVADTPIQVPTRTHAFRDVFREIVPDRKRGKVPALNPDMTHIGLFPPPCTAHRRMYLDRVRAVFLPE